MGEHVVFLVIFDTCDVMQNWSMIYLKKLNNKNKNVVYRDGIKTQFNDFRWLNKHETQQMCNVHRPISQL